MSMNPGYRIADLTFRSTTRGPITWIFDGKGTKPWLARISLEPGWVYRFAVGLDNSEREVCWRCAVDLERKSGGLGRLTYQDEPPLSIDQCTRCERSYGERSG